MLMELVPDELDGGGVASAKEHECALGAGTLPLPEILVRAGASAGSGPPGIFHQVL